MQMHCLRILELFLGIISHYWPQFEKEKKSWQQFIIV
jgi:hypothetical protein